MPSRRRDRHQRGLRGPTALPNRWTAAPARVNRRPSRSALFDQTVRDTVVRLARHCPDAVRGVEIGIEEVPDLGSGWDSPAVPLAVAVAATPATAGRVVLYRRPLELRCDVPADLRDLVRRTLVEQLAALSGIDATEIDPDGDLDD